ncbi:MAG: deoxyribodipyrimidine photo-lyase [Cyclobacteriaceae bacterium]
MTHKKIIVWFRNDLRLKDNLILQKASELGTEIIPVYCFDPRQFQITQHGFPKTGVHKARFLLETGYLPNPKFAEEGVPR